MSSDDVEKKIEPASESEDTEPAPKTETNSGAETVAEKNDTVLETTPATDESKKESDDKESTADNPSKDEETVEEKSNSTVEETSFSFDDAKSENNISQASEADSNISSQSNDITNETISSPNINNSNSDEIKPEKKLDSPVPLSNGDVKDHGKENEKNNVLSDDLIFVKPKDKDRGHCYWYSICFESYLVWIYVRIS